MPVNFNNPAVLLGLGLGNQQVNQQVNAPTGDASNPFANLGTQPSGGIDSSQATALAIMQAMGSGGQLNQAGYERSAGPVGSITKNLGPLVGAFIQGHAYAQAAAAQAKQKQFDNMIALMKASKEAGGGGSDEMDAAKLDKIKAETENLKGEQAYRVKQQGVIDQLTGGQNGAAATAPAGMKPTISYGEKGPSISYRSDVLSPEAFTQQEKLAGARSDQSLSKEEELAKFKKSLPPNMTAKDIETISAGKSLQDLLGGADEAMKSLPPNMNRDELARQAFNYQTRSNHPELANAVTGYTLGMKNFDTDPKLDPYLSWVGQTDAALTSFNLTGMKGGFQTLKYLRAHFPGFADSPQEAYNKAQLLKKDSGIVQQRLNEIQDFYKQKGQMLSAPGAISHPQAEQNPAGVAWMARPYVTKSGQQRMIWLNPDTGESKDMAQGEMPQIPDLGLR